MDFLALLYMLAFAACGVMLARPIFKNDDPLRRFFFGLVFGMVMLIWLPTLWSFILGFTLTAQLLALGTGVALAAGAAVYSVLAAKKSGPKKPFDRKAFFRDLKPLLIAAVPLTAIGVILHFNHTIVPASNGSLHVGQCTYGDLCMHLGFISSISVQQTFPPDYSILPGTRLGYPFLCDSVSSTFLTVGASLRTAAMLPALYAHLLAVLGVYFFFDTWFKNKKTAVLGTYMFMIGGGLGFWYIFNNKQLLDAQGIDRIGEMLYGFYQTPTNIPAEGLRWVNAIADMLLPQRATLFGWALLFPALQLLYRGAIERENRVFIPLAVLAGALPLIHTHSFVALGMISVLLLVSACLRLLRAARPGENTRFACLMIGCLVVAFVFGLLRVLPIRSEEQGFDVAATSAGCAAAAAAAFVITAVTLIRRLKNKESFVLPLLLGAAVMIVCAAALIGVRRGNALAPAAPLVGAALLVLFALLQKKEKDARPKQYRDNEKLASFALSDAKKNLLFFLLFGVITLVLAAPQLLGFTFKQSGNSSSFLRWNFNWDNTSDSWLWFYIKNLGLIFILMIPAFIFAKKEHRLFFAGGLVIWAVCEILLFQPNPYDNNKLLFVWFALTCGIVSDYLVNTLGVPAVKTVGGNTVKDRPRTAARYVVFAIVLVSVFLSGVLTLTREYVSGDHIGLKQEADGTETIGYTESGYEVTPSYMVLLTDWIKDNTEPDALFLTHNNHNNAIAMLTGRNIFCGSGTFLYYHGVDYRPREALIDDMYEDPAENLMKYAEEYGIDYVLVSPYETGRYNVDKEWFESNLECVYRNSRVSLYRIGG